MPVRLATEDAVAQRIIAIRRLLKSLVRPGTTLTVERSKATGAVLLYVHDGLLRGSTHGDSYFRSVNARYQCQYHELWHAGKGGEWNLVQSYLTVFRRGNTRLEDPRQLLCLHVDPLEPESERHWKLKRCPHLHVLTSEDPLPHMHIALEQSRLKETLRSIESLSQKLEQAVKMVRHQLVDVGLPAGEQISL